MKVWSVAALLFAVGLSGCSSLMGDCIDAGTAEARYDGAMAWMDNLGSAPFTMRVEGTIEGEVDSYLIRGDPDHNALEWSSSDETVVFEHPYISFETEELTGYWRDHDDRNDPATIMAELLGDDASVSFADDAGFSDYAVDCTTLGSLDVLRFTLESDDTVDEFLVPVEGTAYPVSGTVVDPALQDNFRFSVSIDRPVIKVDDTLDRLPIDMDILDFDFDDVGDGFVSSGTLGPDTEWAPISELDLVIIDLDTGLEWDVYEFEEGDWELDEGYYVLEDRDNNDLLSEGDYLEIGLAYDFDWELLDTWADAYVGY